MTEIIGSRRSCVKEDVEAIRKALARAKYDTKALDNTTLSECQKKAMRETIRQGVEILEKELKNLRLDELHAGNIYL